MGTVADAIPPFPTVGRVHAEERLVGPGDATPSGRARLDTIVDWLQGVAYGDVLDAGIDRDAVWVLRRTTLRVPQFPRFGERLTLRTAVSGYGALWAERRTSIRGDAGAGVEAVAIWVSLDPVTLRPARVDRFVDLYGESAGDRRVRARLHHPAPPEDAVARPWQLREADLDVAGHINNAAYWQAIEEELVPLPLTSLEAEIEHHAALAEAGPATLLSAGDRRWLRGSDGELHASFVLGRPPEG
ncbi:MAG: hypothetical protein JWQ48_214 [Conexibacter sp.]|nr:hypothetical protein [Conexibacter sp.]